MRCSSSETSTRAERGAAAENSAVRLLKAAGLVIVARNVRCRFGEIDVIARDGETLVFVEVRLRADTRFGGGLASVDAHKQARLIRTAGWYLQAHPREAARPCRFDVILLAKLDTDPEWIRDAFRLHD